MSERQSRLTDSAPRRGRQDQQEEQQQRQRCFDQKDRREVIPPTCLAVLSEEKRGLPLLDHRKDTPQPFEEDGQLMPAIDQRQHQDKGGHKPADLAPGKRQPALASDEPQRQRRQRGDGGELAADRQGQHGPGQRRVPGAAVALPPAPAQEKEKVENRDRQVGGHQGRGRQHGRMEDVQEEHDPGRARVEEAGAQAPDRDRGEAGEKQNPGAAGVQQRIRGHACGIMKEKAVRQRIGGVRVHVRFGHVLAGQFRFQQPERNRGHELLHGRVIQPVEVVPPGGEENIAAKEVRRLIEDGRLGADSRPAQRHVQQEPGGDEQNGDGPGESERRRPRVVSGSMDRHVRHHAPCS
jgi:hypothetical protein